METYSEELSQELAKHVDLTLHVLPGQPDGSTPSVGSLILFGLKTVWLLLTKERGYDVVHGADMVVWPLVLVGRLTSPRAALVLSAHGTDVSYGDRSGIAPALYRAYAAAGARLLRTAWVVANSKATAERAGALGYPNVEVVPLASRPIEVPTSESPKPFVLFVGRHFERRKGLRWFIDEVLPLLPEGISLYVASPLRGARDARRLAHDRVRLLGPVRGHALRTLMAEAICVVVPNIPLRDGHFEGFGLVTVETAASGGVALASRIDGFSDSVIDGVTGFLLPPEDSSIWARAIMMIADCPLKVRRQFVEAAKARAAEHFSWERVARDTCAAYAKGQGAHSEPPASAPPSAGQA
jgi:glycosyltransferase involved in cell wall biosynthesis